MDTQERYQQNQQSRAEDLRRHGWWEHEPFDYHFNSAGFRSDEFNKTPGTLYLGCSFTMGIGLPYTDTWPYKISLATGTACWNLGQGGGSMDTCFRLAEYWIPRLRPAQVVLMSTIPERLEWVDAEAVPRLYSAHGASPVAREWLAHPENARLNHLKNRWAIQQICHREKIPFHECSHSELGIKNSLARDLIHPGKTAHRIMAEKIVKALTQVQSV